MAFISIGGLSAAGVVTDHPAFDLPLNVFNIAEDVEFSVNGIRPVQEEQGIFDDVAINPLHVTRVKLSGGIDAFVYLGLADAYIVYNAQQVKITRIEGDGGGYQANREVRWQDAILHGIPIFNNTVDVPQELDIQNPTGALKDLSNWPSGLRVNALRPYKNFLIALGIQNPGTPFDEQSLIWSSPADPGSVPPSWDFTDPATLAGLFTFSETDDRIVDGLTLGDEFLVYKERSIYSMRFVGGQFVMSIKRKRGDIGLLAKGAVADFPGGHVFVGADDVYQYNGSGAPTSVANGRVRLALFDTLTAQQKTKVLVKHEAARNNIWIFYPEGVGVIWNNRALVWNYQNNTWSFRKVPDVSGATFGDLTAEPLKSWDDYIDVWGEKALASWEEVTETWLTVNANWEAVPGDDSPWDSDATGWNEAVTWDSLASSVIWDERLNVPVIDNIIMCSFIEENAVYDPITNTSSSGNLVWPGQNPYPPFWVVPPRGNPAAGRLVRRGLAIVGRDHMGQPKVDRTVRKILTEFYPEVQSGKIRVRFGVHETPLGDIDWEDFMDFDPEIDQFLNPFINGKYLAFEVQGVSEGPEDWLLSGYGMEVKRGGRY